MRFDEVELETVPLEPQIESAVNETAVRPAPRLRRLLALLTDISLFVALAVGLSPFLPQSRSTIALSALAGFVVIVSFYYFVGTWILWGKTIGGAIFDVKVIASKTPLLRSDDALVMPLPAAAKRWGALYLSVATAGLGFLLALLPSRRSLADRLSSTECIAA